MTTESAPSQDAMYAIVRDEFDFYLAHQDELVVEYDGKVIVLKNHEVIGAYDSPGEAYVETKKAHEPGTFLIQRVSPGAEAYTSSYNSRVVFS